MTKFLTWFESDLKLDPVLKAGIAHLWFVTIHPFEDGNGPIKIVANSCSGLQLLIPDNTGLSLRSTEGHRSSTIDHTNRSFNQY
jgi:hypothetical protein